VPGAGPLVTFAKPGVGAVATQSWVNVYLGIDGLRLLEQGLSAEETLQRLVDGDSGRNVRQVGVVDGRGESASWSGPDCTSWFGHRTGRDYAAQGNMLVGEATVTAMAEAFEQHEALDLPERLLVSLEAAQAAGGDMRGRQSAALYVVDKEEYPLVDLRVDEHPYPVAELRRIFEIAKLQLFPFVTGLPNRSDQQGKIGDDVAAMLLAPPPQRPGGGGSAPDSPART
jgi:uncharacterized Ntn-hydrolase superfamily protein